MAEITVMDRVQIVKANPGEERYLNRIGQVIMVADGTRYIVRFDDNSGGTFQLDQLKKVPR